MAAQNTSALISVIIPVYNVEKYLPACLDSVRAQDYQNLEVLLIDDGSTDGSGEICRRYADKDARFRVLTQRNQGQGAARNHGLDQCRGVYIAFADSDDVLAPDCVSALYALIKERPGFIASGEAVSFPEREVCVFPPFSGEDRCLTPEEALLENLYQRSTLDAAVWGRLYPASLFADGKVRFPETYYEDLGTVYRLLRLAKGVTSTKKCLYGYRQCSTGTMLGGFTEKKGKDILTVTERLRRDLQGTSMDKAARCRCFCAVSNVYMTIPDGQYRDSADALWRKMKEYRGGAVLNPAARRKARVGAVASLFGPKLMRFFYRLAR